MRGFPSTVAALLLIAGLTAGQAPVCPAANLIAPCSCADSGDGTTLTLDCFSQGLTDSRVSTILNAFRVNEISPLREVVLWQNQLTTVPTQLRGSTFPRLDTIDLDENQITALASGTFNLNSPLVALYLNINGLSTIAAGAFQGNIGATLIELSANSFTRFESGVFQQMLEKMTAAGGLAAGYYVDIEDTPIDCVTDPCHMAWLIRDNPNLLSSIGFAVCADGTPFGQLNVNNYANC